jgi:hypothetical protein
LVYKNNGQIVHATLGIPVLGAHETREIDFDQLAVPSGVPVGAVALSYSGPDAALVGRVFGIAEDPSFGFYSALETYTPRAVNEVYWSIVDGTASLLTITNFGDKADGVEVILTYNGGQYSLPAKMLQPLESATVNVGDLKKNGSIPAGADYGGFRIVGASSLSRLLVKEHIIDEASRTSAPFYGQYPYPIAYWMDPSSLSLGVGSSDYTTGWLEWNDYSEGPDYGTAVYSENTSVATTAASGFNDGSYQVTGQNQGTVAVDGVSGNYNYDQYGDCCQQFEAQAQVQVTCAYPVNYRQTTGYDSGNGTLHFEYAWDSSDSSLQHLSGCLVGEHVAYPGSANPYVPPSPPFASNVGFPNPTDQLNVRGSDGMQQDNHGYPYAFVTPLPLPTTSFTAIQYYQFTCACRNGGLPVKLYPTDGSFLNITRKVDSTNGTTGTFTVTKSGVSSSKAVP